MAARLAEELDVQAELVRGHGGVFVVAVDGQTVATKTYDGFPTDDECLRAVRAALKP